MRSLILSFMLFAALLVMAAAHIPTPAENTPGAAVEKLGPNGADIILLSGTNATVFGLEAFNNSPLGGGKYRSYLLVPLGPADGIIAGLPNSTAEWLKKPTPPVEGYSGSG